MQYIKYKNKVHIVKSHIYIHHILSLLHTHTTQQYTCVCYELAPSDKFKSYSFVLKIYLGMEEA